MTLFAFGLCFISLLLLAYFKNNELIKAWYVLTSLYNFKTFKTSQNNRAYQTYTKSYEPISQTYKLKQAHEAQVEI